MAEQIRAVMIVEIMGRPAEHVKESLKQHVEGIDKIKNIEVASISLSEPKPLEDHKDFFTCFAEVEVLAETFLEITHLIFDFMPSSVEIIKPDKIEFPLFDATSFLNDLSGRLHKYDEIAKIAKMQNQQLAQKIIELNGKLGKEDKTEEQEKPDKKPKKTKKKKKGKKKKS